MADSPICSIKNCGKQVAARGWCSMHYTRWQRRGDPEAGRTPDGEPMAFIDSTVLQYTGRDCLIWPFGRNGHGVGMVWQNGSMTIVPRYICERTNGPAPTPEHEAAHSCGRGHEGCVNPHHLRWATHAENMQDTILHRTSLRGTKNGSAKLTETQVREIRSLGGLMLQREIAEIYGVHRVLIGDILRRRIWGWLV